MTTQDAETEARRQAFAAAIRKGRGARTVEDVGKAIGASPFLIRGWEAGTDQPSLEQLRALEVDFAMTPGLLSVIAGYAEPESGSRISRMLYTDSIDELVESVEAAARLMLRFSVHCTEQPADDDSTILGWALELEPTDPPEAV
ncbi:helix-turn-helix transcriptional regulator [Acidimicrobiia bacterium EGI L10123]|uniref:hypothetical protein n=1 Tax=Salinilacustrithrix flava TaxID=2957203 RepID=UPI003D7C2C62|nr:helix-turn-helix transcriptional regulator [Acidimicrobiia bacterium EGI L10123]